MKALFAVVLATFATGPTFTADTSAATVILRDGQPCQKLFTVRMARRAINAVYDGTRDVSKHQRKVLARIERCQRNPLATKFVHRMDRVARAVWYHRRHPPMYHELASWYNDAGGTACGFHATYGVANKKLPCGTHVLIRYHGAQVDAVVQDRGPYVGGRIWDLNQGTAGALGFDGVDTVLVSVSGA